MLAHIPAGAEGTKGRGLFLLRKTIPSHNSDSYEILRVKDKFAVKPMASSEIECDETEV